MSFFVTDSEGILSICTAEGCLSIEAYDSFYTLNAVEVGTGWGEPDGFFALDQETANYLVNNFHNLL